MGFKRIIYRRTKYFKIRTIGLVDLQAFSDFYFTRYPLLWIIGSKLNPVKLERGAMIGQSYPS